MATWAALTPTGIPPAATTPRAELPLSTTTRSLPAHHGEGGASDSSARGSLPPPTVEAVVAVLAQMTLAHARIPPQKGTVP